MLRTMGLLMLTMIIAASGSAADVVSMKLCTVKDCAEGTVVQGSATAGVLYFVSAIKSSEDVEIYHVWIADGKTTGKVAVYDSAAKTLRDAETSELNWLKERKIEGARMIVKMKASSSPRFRVRSQKTFTSGMAGEWKVQVYEGTNTAPLGEHAFTVGK